MLYHNFLTNTDKRIHKWIHYFPVYEKHFKKFVNESIVFWEIGVFKGGSLQMWKRYFGPFVKIIGIDINPECKKHEDHQIHVCIGDQSDHKFLQSVIDEHGAPDIVLDDGSHVMEHVCKTFEFLYDKVSKNGVYMVEDMHTAYWDEYGGGVKRDGTFIERCKDLIDLLNVRHWEAKQDAHKSDSLGHCREAKQDVKGNDVFAKSTFSMSFYDSIVAFDKKEWHADSLKSLIYPKLYKKLKNKTVLLFGSGIIGKYAKSALEKEGVCVSAFVDNDKSKQHQTIDGVVCLPLEEAINKNPDAVFVITIGNDEMAKNVFEQIKSVGFSDENRIFDFSEV
ncbi:MAG: hypothetical protein FWF76_01755 [Oscillospiraceae bacterium]|nr:hypothetical protein [Oscillospiraceae bacterium]